MQYLAEIDHKPVLHTLSDDYLNTKHAAQSYLALHDRKDFQIISLNEVSLDHLLNDYDLMALLFDPKYDQVYYQDQIDQKIANGIRDVQTTFDAQHVQLTKALKHPRWLHVRITLTNPLGMFFIYPLGLMGIVVWWMAWLHYFWAVNDRQFTHTVQWFLAGSVIGALVLMWLSNWVWNSYQLRHDLAKRERLPKIVKQQLDPKE